MHGTTARLRTDFAARLAGLERDRPEWKTWLALLREVEWELGNESPAASRQSPVVSPDTPMLQGQALQVDPSRLQSLVRRLTAVAGGSLQEYRPNRDEATRLLDAAVRMDEPAISVMAAEARIDAQALGSIAYLAAFPVLTGYARQLQSQVSKGWPHGYCPICGAWPTLAERRGLDRSRWLRCGRCSAAWEVVPLWCNYCGENDHHKLGSLVPDGTGETVKMDTCETCRGYLKSLATLLALEPFELLLQDLETVELDLVAVEWGYRRPERVANHESRAADGGAS